MMPSQINQIQAGILYFTQLYQEVRLDTGQKSMYSKEKYLVTARKGLNQYNSNKKELKQASFLNVNANRNKTIVCFMIKAVGHTSS